MLIQSSRTTKSSRTDSDGAYAVAAVDAGANVLAIGDMTFLQPPYNQVADNAILIRHVADFLLEAPRIRDLKDFPFLFQREVAIVPMRMSCFRRICLVRSRPCSRTSPASGIPSAMAPGVMAGKDLILLATFSSPGIDGLPQSARHPAAFPDLLSIEPIAYPQIEIPGFGSVPASGIGLILFPRTEDRSTLILLAEDSDIPCRTARRHRSGRIFQLCPAGEYRRVRSGGRVRRLRQFLVAAVWSGNFPARIRFDANSHVGRVKPIPG